MDSQYGEELRRMGVLLTHEQNRAIKSGFEKKAMRCRQRYFWLCEHNLIEFVRYCPLVWNAILDGTWHLYVDFA